MKPKHIIWIDAAEDGEREAAIYGRPSWPTTCVYAAVIALGIGAAILILMPVPH